MTAKALLKLNNDEDNKKNNIIDDRYKEVRIGAMEVLLCTKIKGNKNIFQLFSKLQSHQWPSISKLLDMIIQYVPKFSMNINIYDKESGMMDSNKEFEEIKDEDFTFSKYENIKINVYYINNEKVKEICNIAAEGMEINNYSS